MKTGEKLFWRATGVVALGGTVLLLALLLYGYASDEWGTPPLDERSVPAVRMY
ncbi:MAG: hypothetical protein AB7G75_20025 [Candidatus Binatia bacterium]